MAVFVIGRKLDSLGNGLSQYLPTLEDYVVYKKHGIVYDLSPRYVIKINSSHFYVLKEVGVACVNPCFFMHKLQMEINRAALVEPVVRGETTFLWYTLLYCLNFFIDTNFTY